MNDKEQKNLRVFGYGLAVILSFIGIRHGMKHGWAEVSGILLLAAAGLALLTALRLPAVGMIYRPWMKAAHAIGFVVSTVILSLLFYVFFTLFGAVLRILKKDLLDEAVRRDAGSYWIVRPPEELGPERYKRQF
ncbi:MAG: hypothetical protein Q8Q08_04310 [Candidatus Omnitrophota bacterium]|nr:hypothetical protein [Candidatus Omnitrophota bacterium]MDZ4241454.1 hypothetical protein [Candidatus Omnitrophota bacterium]